MKMVFVVGQQSVEPRALAARFPFVGDWAEFRGR